MSECDHSFAWRCLIAIAAAPHTSSRSGSALGIEPPLAEALVDDSNGTTPLAISVSHPRHTLRNMGSEAPLHKLVRQALQHCALRSVSAHTSQGVKLHLRSVVFRVSRGSPSWQDSLKEHLNLPSAASVHLLVFAFRMASSAAVLQPGHWTVVGIISNGASPRLASLWFSAQLSQHSTSNNPVQSDPHGYSMARLAKFATRVCGSPPSHVAEAWQDIFNVAGSVVHFALLPNFDDASTHFLTFAASHCRVNWRMKSESEAEQLESMGGRTGDRSGCGGLVR